MCRRVMLRVAGVIFCVLFFSISVLSQESVITAGFQFKPVFSSKFFKTGKEEVVMNNINYSITPKSGYNFGMVIRKGFTKTLSVETGINYVKRNYTLGLETDTISPVESGFSIIGYEIPLQGLVFIQLSDKIYMDVALGMSVDFYPSDVFTKGEYFEHSSDRRSWLAPAVLANLGWEYRTEQAGYFYLGASYHNPFDFIYRSFIVYPEFRPGVPEAIIELNGNYLTFDLRYFFHSDPQKRKKKIRKNNSKTR